MLTVERRQWRRSGVFMNMCHTLLIADFEQANVSWIDIENTNIFEGEIRYVMRYAVAFPYEQN